MCVNGVKLGRVVYVSFVAVAHERKLRAGLVVRYPAPATELFLPIFRFIVGFDYFDCLLALMVLP